MRREIVVIVAALAGVGLTARLGLWQLDRAAEKLALQAMLEARTAMPALEARDLARDAGLAWDTVGPPLKREGRPHLETY